MTPLVINQEFKKNIKKIVKYAELNPFSIDDILDVMNGQELPAGDNKNHYFIDQFGTKIVYSIELQPKGKVRHLSVSVDKDEAFLNPIAVREIMELIGFQNILERCKVQLEKFEFNPKRGAINVLEAIKP